MSNLSFNNTQYFRTQLLNRNLPYTYGVSDTLPANFTDTTYNFQNSSDMSVPDQSDVSVTAVPIINNIGSSNLYGPEQYQPINLQTTILNLGPTLNYLESFIVSEDRGALGLISVLTGQDIGEGDTKMVEIARAQLRGMALETMGVKLSQSTLGRINALEAINDPDVLNGLLTGREPIIERDYQITVPGNPITRAAEYFARVSGTQLPVSYIPGSFFEENVEKGRVEGFLDKAGQTVGQILNMDFNSHKKTYSQKLLQYTSGGQKSRLFTSVNYNKYKPNYDSSVGGVLNNVKGSIQSLAGLDPSDGLFYLGGADLDPGILFTYDAKSNKEKGYMVSGPSIMVKMFEGDTPLNTFPDGGRNYLNGTSPANTETQFVWIGDRDNVRGEINGVSVQSTEKTLNPNSILARTQEIIDDATALDGEAKLKHPGHVISNVAYKYHDGYKIISKGNAVRGMDDEFCRVWTKDYGYDRYGRLVRYKGIQDTQRRIPGSVIRSQMMLNIAPTIDENGKPINFGIDESGKNITKYMFSIENLAWAGSDKLTERPICEQGPNGGRIMWFPPYDLKYTDDNRANWTTHTFLGRPEPIYTYNNAERTGTLSFKVVVDHPMIFNLLRKKHQKGFTDVQKQEIMDSFIAGCRDFDLYELANEFMSLSMSEIVTLENYLAGAGQNGTLKFDQVTDGPPRVVSEGSNTTTEITPIFKEKYGETEEIQIYWFNDIPGPQNSVDRKPSTNFEDDFNGYLSMFNDNSYQTLANKLSTATQTNVSWGTNELDEFKAILEGIKPKLDEIKKTVQDTLKQDERFSFEIIIESTTSAVATQKYNDALASRRAESLKKYLLGSEFEGKEEKIKIVLKPVGENRDFQGFNCNEIQKDVVSGVDERIYSKSATYCRTARATIKVLGNATKVEITPTETEPTYEWSKIQQEIKTEPTDNILSLLLKSMHSECDYFYELKETDPLVFNNLVDKLKYFQPGFHSTTPEGLNKRLTFLQQCLRPGETIKVYDETNNEVTNLSSNTAFGRPPVCVLRIGDFFHTKMIVDSVNFTYDDSLWDMNPEGIGMQPMIASVNMGVKFIGGHGISNVIDELQNALSFNYYANTEVYDEMATKTDGGRDSEFLSKITSPLRDKLTAEYAKVQNNVELSPDNDGYWGNISEEDESIITYNQFYNGFVSEVNDYANQLITSVKTLTDTYGQTAINPLFYIGDKSNRSTSIRTGTTNDVDVSFIGVTTYDYNKDFSDVLSKVKEHFNSDDFVIDTITNTLDPIYLEMKKKVNFNEEKNEEFRKMSLFVLSSIEKDFNGYGSDISGHLYTLRQKHSKLQKSLDALDIILGDEIDGYYDDKEKKWVIKYLNNLTVNNGNLGEDVNEVLTKLNDFVVDITSKVRNNTIASLTGQSIQVAKQTKKNAVNFFYDEILPYYLKGTMFDIDSGIENNQVFVGNKKVREEYAKALRKYKNTPKVNYFNISDYKWNNIGDASLVYDFKMTDSTNPSNEAKITEYHDKNNLPNTSGVEESKYIWKTDLVSELLSPLMNVNLSNLF